MAAFRCGNPVDRALKFIGNGMDMLRFLVRVVAVLLVAAYRLTRWMLRQLYRLVRFLLAGRRTSHGSARFASLWDLVRGRAWGGRDGIIVGKAWFRFVRFKMPGATLVYAPMGRGKGTGVVIPAILDAQGAICVTDPKGENFAITARHRATIGPVYRLDAINPHLSDRFNPLSMIRVGTLHEVDDTAQIAELLVIAESRDAHWDTSAKAILTAIIRHIMHARHPVLQTLSTVREEIASGPERLRALLTEMTGSELSSVAEEARAMLGSFDTQETASVIKNAAKAMAFWSKDRIGGQLTAGSNFDLMDLHKYAVSIFIMVPDDNLKVYAPFLRMLMGCAVAALMRGKHLPRPRHKPLLMIDECAALGPLDALEKGMGLLREYCNTVLVWQDLGQLQDVYRERARSFMAASGCQVTFGVSDVQTARDLADTVGRTTILSRSHGVSQANSDLLKAQLQAGRSETGRYLRDPAEIRRLPQDRCLIFMQDQVSAPILARKVRYYKERRWRGLYDAWRAEEPAEVVAFTPPAPPAPAPADDEQSISAA